MTHSYEVLAEIIDDPIAQGILVDVGLYVQRLASSVAMLS